MALVERSAKAVRLSLAGGTVRSIASELGVSVASAHADLVLAADRIRRASRSGRLKPEYLTNLVGALSLADEEKLRQHEAEARAEAGALEASMRATLSQEDGLFETARAEVDRQLAELSVGQADADAVIAAESRRVDAALLRCVGWRRPPGRV